MSETRRPARCPSCDHEIAMHQPDGCWYTVSTGLPGLNLCCVCSVPSEDRVVTAGTPDLPEGAKIVVLIGQSAHPISYPGSVINVGRVWYTVQTDDGQQYQVRKDTLRSRNGYQRIKHTPPAQDDAS